MKERVLISKCVRCGRVEYVTEGTPTVCRNCGGQEHITIDKPSDRQVGGDHYKLYAIQPAVFLRSANVPHLEGEAIYHVLRHARKNGVEDLDKAIHYIELIKELDYKEKGV